MTQQTADDDIAVLKQTAATATEGKKAAEARADAAEDELGKARAAAAQAIADRTRADKAAAANGIAAAEQEIANLETRLAAAMKTGDAAEVAKSTRGIATAQGRLDQMVSVKGRIERWEKDQMARFEAAAKAARENPQPRQPTRPTGSGTDISAYSAETQTWLNAHPEVRDSADKMAQALKHHHAALGEDLTPDTPAYFKFIEKRLGIGKQEEKDDENVVDINAAPDEPPPPPATDTAAAPSRGNGNGQAKNTTGRIRLTQAEMETARNTFSWLKTDDEKYKAYAKNKAELIKEGRLPNG